MSGRERQNRALQVIFAFFLGLMVTAFIGVGVYTFYPSGADPIDGRRIELHDEQSDIRDARSDDGFSDAQRERLDAIEDELREVGESARERREAWARTTSVILILFATMVMGISLVRADHMPVISNGLLLGGVFTMLYGTGWTLASGDSLLRFWVMVFALVVTLGLGWVRFVRRQPTAPAAGGASAEIGELAGRVEELERRLDSASEAMKGP